MSKSLLVSKSLVLLALGCGSATAPTATPSQPEARRGSVAATTPEAPRAPPIQPLRAGRIEPIESATPIQGSLLGRVTRDVHEILVVRLPAEWRTHVPERESKAGLWSDSDVLAPHITHVAVGGQPDNVLSFALLDDSDPTPEQMRSSAGPPPPADTLWLRRPRAEAGQPLTASIYTAADGSAPGVHLKVLISDSSQLPESTDTADQFTRALHRYVRRSPPSLFRTFALSRLDTSNADLLLSTDESLGEQSGWSELMELGTGRQSVQHALQRTTKLRSEANRHRPTLPISKLAGPQLPTHPYTRMLSELGATPPLEALARATPADFYFARSRDLDALFDVLDEVDAWVTPAVRLLDARLQRYDLTSRYQTQLGMPRSALSRVVGPQLVEEIAVVGSDPFLRDGSDLTVIFKPKSPASLDAALLTKLSSLSETHGGLTTTKEQAQGAEVSFTVSADGAVHRYSTTSGGLSLVSNSRAAIERILATLNGKYPALDDEPDFKYMLARDAGVPADILAYAGDRFLTQAVSPASRVLDARRQIAKSELLRASYAALLYGWVYGKTPSQELIVRSALPHLDVFRHFDKQPIRFNHDATGVGPRSAWGTPRALTPLIDLPTPKQITLVEQEAYNQFRSRYERLWSQALDPIALRLRIHKDAQSTHLGAKLRVLPVVSDHDTVMLQGLVGDARVEPGASADGLRILLALAEDSRLRRELSGGSRAILGKRLALEWIGGFAMIGLLDDPALPNAMLRTKWAPQKPTEGASKSADLDGLAAVPVYAALELESRTGAALALAVLRERLGSIGEWSSLADHRGQKVVRVQLRGEPIAVHYALTDRMLYVTLTERTLKALIDRELDGTPPPRSAGAKQGRAQGAQWVIDLAGKAKGGLWTAASWLLEHQQRDVAAVSFEASELVFRGLDRTASDPREFERAAYGYLGMLPITPDGRLFTVSKSGVTDPNRGNAHAPAWPTLPVPDSPIERVFSGLAEVRSQLGFEDEPRGGEPAPQRSLSVTLEAKRRLEEAKMQRRPNAQ